MRLKGGVALVRASACKASGSGLQLTYLGSWADRQEANIDFAPSQEWRNYLRVYFPFAGVVEHRRFRVCNCVQFAGYMLG